MREDLASVLAGLRRENVDVLRKKAKTLRKDVRVKRKQHLTQCFMLLDDTNELETGIRKWEQLWDSVDTLLPELVSLANIQPTEYWSFCLVVHDRLLKFIDSDWSADRDDKMLEAEKRLRAAQDAIAALSEYQRRSITIAMLGSIPFDGDDWTQQILKILDGISKITESAPYRPNDPSKRGPKKKERVSVALREFVRDLWSIAQAHGGDFSVGSKPDPIGSGTSAVGTLVDALRLLEPVLPSGFVSNMPSFSTLNRCRPKSTTPLKGD
jgi:hypothetical protein